MVCATSKASDQPAHARSLIRAFTSRLNILSVKLLTEHHLELPSLKGGCTGSSESTLVKMPHCWKSHVTAHNMIQEKSKLFINLFQLYPSQFSNTIRPSEVGMAKNTAPRPSLAGMLATIVCRTERFCAYVRKMSK